MEIKQKLMYLKRNKLSIFYQFLKLVVCCVVMYAINNVIIFDSINPFGFAMLFALIGSGFNPLLIGVIFVGTFVLINYSLNTVKVSLIVFIICFVLFVVNKFKRINYRFGLSYILCIVSFLPFVWFSLGDPKHNSSLTISLLFALFFLYICMCFFRGTIKRGFSQKLNPDEIICGSILLVVVAYGLSIINFFGVQWAIVVCVLVSLIASYTFGSLQAIVISFVFGLGVSLGQLNPINIAFLVSFGVFSCAFRSKTKIFSAISMVVVYLLFTLYFSEYLIFSIPTLIAIIVASLVFVLLPNRLILYMKDIFAGYKDKLAVRNVVKTSKQKMCKKLEEVGKVFREMEFVFKRSLQKTLPLKDRKDLIKQDLVECVCKTCSHRHKCLRINGDYTTQVFDSLVDAGIAKGSVSDVDVNNYVYSRCPRLPILINSANEIIRSYREYNILSKNMDCSKILVAEQFKGVSGVLQELSKELSEDIAFDTDLETRIMQDLLYKNVFVEEVVVYDKGVREKDVVLLVKNLKPEIRTIEKIVSKACRCMLKVVSVEPSDLPNVSVMQLATMPNYDVIFGSSSCNKTGTIISGDTHSFIKIDNGKYMLALSDGMGSGTNARETSDLSIGLIENYYKAGFDSNLILSSVNKLLSLNNEETFSATDICIFDFFANTMDFIKLGTPNSYIKRKNSVELVQSSGLPIGILEEIRPHITKRYITNFDIVILVSDGIADAFARENLQVFINNLNLINPQEIADAIMQKAKSLVHSVCEDDMTVLVARIFPTK